MFVQETADALTIYEQPVEDVQVSELLTTRCLSFVMSSTNHNLPMNSYLANQNPSTLLRCGAFRSQCCSPAPQMTIWVPFVEDLLQPAYTHQCVLLQRRIQEYACELPLRLNWRLYFWRIALGCGEI